MNDDEQVIVSVARSDLGAVTDFALATDRPVGEIASMIADALRWEGPLEVFADPPGRLLRSTETPAEAGVWDGAALVIGKPGAAEGVPHDDAKPGPVYAWKRIDSS